LFVNKNKFIESGVVFVEKIIGIQNDKVLYCTNKKNLNNYNMEAR